MLIAKYFILQSHCHCYSCKHFLWYKQIPVFVIFQGQIQKKISKRGREERCLWKRYPLQNKNKLKGWGCRPQNGIKWLFKTNSTKGMEVLHLPPSSRSATACVKLTLSWGHLSGACMFGHSTKYRYTHLSTSINNLHE